MTRQRFHEQLTNMEAVARAVQQAPGHTAYWYLSRESHNVRNSWIYTAFQRAEKHGLIYSEDGPRKGQTVYFPVEQP